MRLLLPSQKENTVRSKQTKTVNRCGRKLLLPSMTFIWVNVPKNSLTKGKNILRSHSSNQPDWIRTIIFHWLLTPIIRSMNRLFLKFRTTGVGDNLTTYQLTNWWKYLTMPSIPAILLHGGLTSANKDLPAMVSQWCPMLKKYRN